jgi:hypothetical protein
MPNQSSSHKALCQALFLIAAIMFQSLAVPGREIVFAKTITPEKKTESPTTPAQQKRSAAPALPQRTPVPNTPQVGGPIISATNRDSFPSHGDSKAHAGDVITYAVAVTNTGTANATGVNYADTIDSNTSTLVGGSPMVQFSVTGDTYSAIGNVKIDTSTITPGSGKTVLENDAPGVATLTGFGSTLANANQVVPNGTNTATTPNGGIVTMNADGSFKYTPAAGFGGAGVTDSFWYTLTNNTIGTGNPNGFPSGAARVTINVSTPIWFVDQAAVGGGNGTLATPFNCLQNTAGCFGAVNDGGANHPAAGHFIFLYKSSGAPGAFSGGVTLLNNQSLIGEGASASLATIAGVSVPAGSATLPTTGNAPPVVTTVAAATNGINLAVGGNATLRGFNIGNTTGAKIASGASFGTLTVSEMALSGAGQALNLTNGALAATFTSITSTSSANQGLFLDQISGSLTATGGTTISGQSIQCITVQGSSVNANFGNTSCTNSGEGIVLNGNTGGTRTFGNLSSTGGNAGAFIHSNNGAVGGGNVTVTGTANLSTSGNPISVSSPASSNTINFGGATTATSTGSNVNGIVWNGGGSTATMTFDSLTIVTAGTNGSGTALLASNGGTITISQATGTINNVTQPEKAIVANGVTLNLRFATVNSSAGTNNVSLTNVAGVSLLGNGSLTGASGNSFDVSGGNCAVTYNGDITHSAATFAAVSVAAGHSGSLTFNTGTISATNGTGLQFNNADGTYNFNGTTTLNAANAGIDIVGGSGGTFGFGANSSVTTTSDFSYNESADTATVIYNGTITKTTSSSAVNITTKTGGSTTFNGAISANTPGVAGINLDSNTGATISFTGGLAISSGTGTGFNAIGGGTVSATQNNTTIVNTLTTTTGTALNVANTTIGGSGLTFRNITAGTGAGGPANGIVLNNTGASGGLVLSGNSGAGTGGTIQKATTAGISLTSVGGSVSLTDMNVTTGTHDGIRGTTVANLSLINCSVTSNGTVAADNGVHITDASGTVTFTNTSVTGSFGDNVDFDSTVSSAAVITAFTVTGGAYSSSTNGAGFLVQLKNNAVIQTGSLTGMTLDANATYAIDIVTNDNSTIGNGTGAPATGTFTISGNTITNDGGVGVSFANGGGSGAGNMYVRFVGNVMTFTKSHAINVVSGAGTTGGTQKVLIDNNCIGMSGAATGTGAGHCGVTPGAVDSGSKLGEGIQVTQQGKTLGTVTITNNVIRNLDNGVGEFGNRVVDVQTLGPSPAQGAGPIPFDVKIVGNNLSSSYPGTFPQAAIYLGVDHQSATTTTMHAEVHGNTVPVGPGCEGNSCTASTGMIFYDEVNTPSTGTLYQCSGAGNPCGGGANANVSTELANTNTGTAGKTCAVNPVNLTLTGTAPATVARLRVPNRATINSFRALGTTRESIAVQPAQLNVNTRDSSTQLAKTFIAGDSVARSVSAVNAERQSVRHANSIASSLTRKERLPEATESKAQASRVAVPTPLKVAAPESVHNRSRGVRSNHAVRSAAAADRKPVTPQSGGTVNLLVAATIPPGSTVGLTYQVTVNNAAPAGTSQISNQGTVTSNAPTVTTDDPDVGGANDPTVTPLLAPTAANGIVSGRITDANGNPVEGAVVRLSGGQSRKMITDANGNYQFDNVDTGGFYTVTPTRANFNFNPFNRSFSQEGNKTEAAFTGTSMGDNANPLDTPEYFVRQEYVDILGREPDEGGFNFWSDKFNQCLSASAPVDLSEPRAVATGSTTINDCMSAQRINVAAAFFIAQEFQQSGAFLYDVYAGALGRKPAYTEYATDRQQVVGGDTLDTEKSVFAQSFVQRAEFTTKYQNAMTAETFVDALIQSVQAQGVDLSSERTNLIGSYNSGADLIQARAAVVRTMADNAAFKQAQYNQAFVLTEYFGYLRRDPEAGGYTFWVGVLNSDGNYRGMVCSFITSTEYQNRFSQVVTRSNGDCAQ